MQATAKALKIKWHMSTAYHPQTDGQTERTNQELEMYLRLYCQSDLTNWAKMLAPTEIAYNARINSITKQAPFEILLGYMPRTIETPHTTETVPEAQE